MGLKQQLQGVALAIGLAAGGADAYQDVTIYVPSFIRGGPPQAIWKDGTCLVAKERCDGNSAETLGDYVQRSHGQLGKSVGDATGRIHILVTKDLAWPGQYREDWIDIKIDISQVPAVRSDGVPHEMGHAFYDDHIGTKTGYTHDVLEHWGTDEGFAFILEKKLGLSVPSPSKNSVADILAGGECKKGNYAACAHDLGALMASVYDRVVESIGADKAFPLFRDAIENFDGVLHGNGSYVTFTEMFVNVLQEAAEIDDENAAQKAAKVVAEAFRDVADVTLMTPTLLSRPEEMEALPPSALPIPPVAWWFNNPALFECRVVNVSNVSCVRRTTEDPDEMPSTTPGVGILFGAG